MQGLGCQRHGSPAMLEAREEVKWPHAPTWKVILLTESLSIEGFTPSLVYVWPSCCDMLI